jgi:D-alanyl-lipoteichoic acid acyltransferase DltB (MBOAT superfamily)
MIKKISAKAATYKPLWNTWEFYTYYIYIGVAMSYWLYRAFRFSHVDTPFYIHYASTLSKGWLFGRMLDDTDNQYRSFRWKLPLLGVSLAVYVFLGHVIMNWKKGQKDALRVRICYDFVCSMSFFMISYGTSCIWITQIVLINYMIGKWGRSMYISSILTWIFSLTILITSEYYHGYHFAPWIPFLDHYRGIIQISDLSWHIHFRLTLLRMISFNMDYRWALNRKQYVKWWEEHWKVYRECQKEAVLCEKMETEQPRPLEDYHLQYYLVYLFYLPLYWAGPIMTFNGFTAQYERRVAVLEREWRSIVFYGLRLINALLIMELMNHLFYVNAISKQRLWRYLAPMDLMIVSYLLLKHVWLKLFIIWRFFRWFARMDGLNPTENMDRCMSNHYSGLEFWKSWHRSFNRWLVRYVYIPLGGAKWRMVNMWIVFTFVAIWHDASLNLLIWGWMICLFIMPELLCRLVFLRKPFIESRYFRHLCAAGGAINIFFMMLANLIGFSLGTEGLHYMMAQLQLDRASVACLAITIFGFFGGVQIMLEFRNYESFKSSYLLLHGSKSLKQDAID